MTALVGTGGMVRLILRRDRFLLPIWILFLAVMPLNFVVASKELYPTAAEQLSYARTTGNNPTFLALYGPLHDTGIGGIVGQRSGFIPVMIALICALTVIRHTRTEEEAGRRELLGATVLGRGAALAAALLVTFVASALIGVILTLGMTGQDLGFGGALALGLQFALAGWVFAGVAGVAAQISEGAGAARGIAVTVLGASFVVRLAADVGGAGNGLSWLSWLSPLGWGTRLGAFGDERWWVAALPLALTLVLVVAAGMLSARRDVGAGLVPPKPGPAAASPGLRGPFSLAWRLHSRPLLAWLAGFAALGMVFGGVAGGVEQMLEENPDLKEIFDLIGGSGGIVDIYFSSIMGMTGLLAAGYAVSATLRLRTEETALRAEPLLATPLGRIRWAASHLAFALLGSAAALLVGGLATGLTHGIDEGDVGGQVPKLVGAALAQLPAVWLIAAVTVAFFGLLPRFSSAGWGALAVAAVLMLFGGALQADQWLMDISPFTHIPKLPGADVTATPLLWLTAAVLALGAAGLTGFRRRDLTTG
ncbi:ABC transporter permease [Actinomadura rugatobispora]|uniref:ABC transporter permease n=1 Tax=Actinomadura rugatobispora TaxID=1994 RepID=A0ABW0ZSW2_9ACTN|nr:exporter of polyketide antibiotics [Actinomadura rugatobispora]